MTRLKTNPRRTERTIMGLKWYNRISNQNLRELTKAKDIVVIVKKLKWSFAGHIAREKGEKWGGKVLNWTPWGLKRIRGRPAKRWRDGILEEFGML